MDDRTHYPLRRSRRRVSRLGEGPARHRGGRWADRAAWPWTPRPAREPRAGPMPPPGPQDGGPAAASGRTARPAPARSRPLACRHLQAPQPRWCARRRRAPARGIPHCGALRYLAWGNAPGAASGCHVRFRAPAARRPTARRRAASGPTVPAAGARRGARGPNAAAPHGRIPAPA